MANRGTNIRFRGTKLELNDPNFSFFYACWTSGGHDDILVEDDTVNEFGVLYRSAHFLDNADVSKVNIGGCWGDKPGYCGYSDWGQRG